MQPSLELYNMSSKGGKIYLSFLIIILSFASDFFPFNKYGLIDKIDVKIERKLCSQLSISILRGI